MHRMRLMQLNCRHPKPNYITVHCTAMSSWSTPVRCTHNAHRKLYSYTPAFTLPTDKGQHYASTKSDKLIKSLWNVWKLMKMAWYLILFMQAEAGNKWEWSTKFQQEDASGSFLKIFEKFQDFSLNFKQAKATETEHFHWNFNCHNRQAFFNDL